MRRIFLITWVLILAVTLVDVAFAWKCQETFQEWESNPVARHLAERHGVGAAILFRLGTICGLALVLPAAPRRWQVIATTVVGVAHLGLGCLYLSLLPNCLS